MKNVIIRAISGAVYVAIIIAAIFAGIEAYFALALVLAALGIVEFHKITTGSKSVSIGLLFGSPVILDILGAATVIAIPVVMQTGHIATCFVYVVARLVVELYLKNEDPVKSLSRSMMAQVYIALPLCASLAIYMLTGPWIVFSLFLFIWINDTGAFLVGITIGKHRLFERISPKKSWEGFFGGLFFCAVTAYILGHFSIISTDDMTTLQYVAMAVLISIAATYGDLIESMIKRSLKIKDSGNLIPGHGGILDRIDSFLLVAPAVICYLFYIGL